MQIFIVLREAETGRLRVRGQFRLHMESLAIKIMYQKRRNRRNPLFCYLCFYYISRAKTAHETSARSCFCYCEVGWLRLRFTGKELVWFPMCGLRLLCTGTSHPPRYPTPYICESSTALHWPPTIIQD